MADKLYANNHEPFPISQEDWQKIGRGYDIGHEFGTVTDTDTGKLYTVTQASCGIGDSCNCAVEVEEQ